MENGKTGARTLGKAARCQPAKAFGNGDWVANRFRLVYIPPRVLIYSRGGRIDFVTVQQGRSNVGGVERTMIPFGSAHSSLEEKWHVIGKGISHEFFPEGEDMAVVSFHTCAAAELVEVASGSGARRIYEPRR